MGAREKVSCIERAALMFGWGITVLFMAGRPSGRGIAFRHCRYGAKVLYQKTL